LLYLADVATKLAVVIVEMQAAVLRGFGRLPCGGT